MYCLPIFLLTISAISALLPRMLQSSKSFHYPSPTTIFYRRSNPYNCVICDRSDCLKMDDVRCEYYREVDEILLVHDEDQDTGHADPALKAEVDVLLFDLTLQESTRSSHCVPHISRYTNCNKDNICLGCTTCDCDHAGRWNCSKTQRCRADVALNVDHRILVKVLEKLEGSKRNNHDKRKRSIKDKVPSKKVIEEETSVSQEISSITNGLNNSKHLVKHNSDSWKNITDSTESMKYEKDTKKNESINESDLEFDDLFPAYNNTNNGNCTKLHLPMLKNHTEDILDPDYIDDPDDNVTQSDDTIKSVEKMLGRQAIKEISLNTQKGTKMMFYTNLNKEVSDLSNSDINTKGDGEENDIYDRQSVHVVKRDTKNLFKNTRIKTLLSTPRHSLQGLNDNVFDPLSSIINEKYNEIRQLEYMRNNLKDYIKIYIKNDTYSNLNRSMVESITKSYLTVYKLEFVPKLENDFIINNTSSLADYMSKLQNDIYEIIRDIVEIQRHSHNKVIPDDLNVLIEAMKYYVHKQGKLHIESEVLKLTEKNKNDHRKKIKALSNNIATSPAVEIIKQILKALDKEMPLSNALAPVSIGAKKILKRVIDHNYNNDRIDNRDFGSHSNITKNLNNFGIKWYKMTRSVASSSLAERLFNMKLLHLEISKDIRKIIDTLDILDFAQARRVILIDKEIGEHITARIEEDIKIINNKIQEIIKLQNNKNLQYPYRVTNATPKTRKDSFLEHVKNILKQSKKDITKIFKTETKSQNKQRFYSPLQIQDNRKEKGTWEIKLDMSPKRNKRSPIEIKNVIKRIRNIIPNYLKSKISGTKNSKLAKNKS